MARPKHDGLSQMQLKFVERYLIHGDGKRAATEAGYSTAGGGKTVSSLKNNPKVIAALDEAQKKAMDKAAKEISYTYVEAMREAESAMNFALSEGNPGAYVRAVEHRSKLSGLLVDRVAVETVSFRIQIGGISDEPKLVTEASIPLLQKRTDEAGS